MLAHETDRAYWRGHRQVTPVSLQADRLASAWRGLPDGVGKVDLLRAIEDMNLDDFQVTARARDLLKLLVKEMPKECFRTRSQIGEPSIGDGLELISTTSNDYIAHKLNVTTRSIPRIIANLVSAGLLAMRDSGNGQRRRIGDPLKPHDAYGFDLRVVVARYEDLAAKRIDHWARFMSLKSQRKELARIKATLCGILHNDLSAELRELAIRTINMIDMIRSSDDLDALTMVALEALDSLEAVKAELPECSTVRMPSWMTQSAPMDDTDASPDTPTQFQNLEEDSYREARRDDVGAAPPPPSPETPLERSGGRNCASTKIILPAVKEILLSLPAALAANDLSTTPDGICKTPEALVEAYAVQSAHRCLLKPSEMRSLIDTVGLDAFCVAMLLAELTPGVGNRRGYLFGIARKVKLGDETVNLRASWRRLARSHRAARGDARSFGRRVSREEREELEIALQ